MKKIILICSVLFLSLALFYSCSSKESETQGGQAGNSLVIYCPHPLEFINPLVDDFKAKNPGINVDIIAAGVGELLKRVESEKDNPLGDILWGGSLNTVKPKVELFENYTTTNEASIADAYKNVEGAITRFTAIPSVIMVNTNLAGNIKIEGYEDLLNPELKGKIAFADPSASSSSFEHLVNMLYAMGKGDPEKGWDYVQKLCANLDGKLLSGSSAVYKGVADGEYTVGLTFEEGGANYVSAGSPVKLVYMKEGVIIKPDGIYIIKNAKNLENAKKFVDYATSYDAQKTINDKLNRRSVRNDLPPSAILQSVDTINVITDDEAVVDQNKQNWLNKFKDIFTSI
ncbi:ABC transporter substrate-binding protein [Brachyspira hyodysenteriae]|uniref:ABC transporter substrate-binding protein n=1 Tax=Brachyspira hyodysenteriae TaxID=159 RepID=UPI001182AF1F|nr:ABC transporter substrate-binding protein [Brachyspira hyodysenteriae]MDA0022918.1 ABC transporter substrate-binding protein [Brachyspira hyodysenteriae]TVL65090.1 ABC transporter substrate-binding protein [Brachyspira hyodysenteriae]TVL76859.1 ABC transporter substrate-binding protein [Brachyspira hyodysenteriae]